MKHIAYFFGLILSILAPNLAFAEIDAGQITTKLDKVNPVIEATGGSIIGIVVTIVVFGFVIGMLFRKGK